MCITSSTQKIKLKRFKNKSRRKEKPIFPSKLRDLKEESAILLNLEVQGYAKRYIAFKKQNYDFIRTSEI